MALDCGRRFPGHESCETGSHARDRSASPCCEPSLVVACGYRPNRCCGLGLPRQAARRALSRRGRHRAMADGGWGAGARAKWLSVPAFGSRSCRSAPTSRPAICHAVATAISTRREADADLRRARSGGGARRALGDVPAHLRADLRSGAAARGAQGEGWREGAAFRDDRGGRRVRRAGASARSRRDRPGGMR